MDENPPFEREKIAVPKYIPDGKYLGIARNEIVIIGDSPQEVSKRLMQNFPKSATGIIHKGYESEKLEFIFSIYSVNETYCIGRF